MAEVNAPFSWPKSSLSISSESGMQAKKFSPEAVRLLQEKSWTGNIRELRNVVERLMILGGNPVSPQDVKDYVSPIQ